jgi:hypothetical protein
MAKSGFRVSALLMGEFDAAVSVDSDFPNQLASLHDEQLQRVEGIDAAYARVIAGGLDLLASPRREPGHSERKG